MKLTVRIVSISWLAGLLLLNGCATSQYASSTPVAVEEPSCQQTFQQWQTQADVGNHFDAQTWSPPGFPFLRVNRLLASFPVAELTPAQQQEWLERTQVLALTAWQFEAASMAWAG
jgi:hypothetical protein